MQSTTLLHTLTEKKEARKVLNNDIKELLTQSIKALLVDIKAVEETLKDRFKAQGQSYTDVNKVSVLKLVKATIDSKESVINTAFNIIELKLSLDYDNLSLSEINLLIKLCKDNVEGFSKSTINKCSSDKLKEKIKQYRATIKESK